MKKVVSFLIMVAIFMVTLASCQKQNITTTTTVKTTVKEIGTEGFLLKKVVKGDTVWGYSQETYGTGMQWREIVIENPFLNEPGRIYYDQEREKWIVLIYPGETVKIKGKVVNPTFISEEKTVKTTTETVGLPWWVWLVITACVVVILFFLLGGIGLLTYHRCCRSCCHCCSTCHEANCPVRQLNQNHPEVYYRTQTDGSMSLSVQGASETVVTRDNNGKMNFTVRR